MKLILEDREITEIPLIEVPSEDKALVIIKGGEIGKRGEGLNNITKEIVAHDSLVLGPAEAARIHGVPESSASKYSNARDIEDADTRARILATRFNITDTATAKLMETLNMFDPSQIEKEKDKVSAAALLASVVDKMSSGEKKNGVEVTLHLYSPKMRPIESYQVIDVE